jgi:hypothetical protein
LRVVEIAEVGNNQAAQEAVESIDVDKARVEFRLLAGGANSSMSPNH